MLDTHYSSEGDARHSYSPAGGGTFSYRRFRENGMEDPFSGTADHAKWLLLSDIERILLEAGFRNFELVEEREERNGPRALIFASKT